MTRAKALLRLLLPCALLCVVAANTGGDHSSGGSHSSGTAAAKNDPPTAPAPAAPAPPAPPSGGFTPTSSGGASAGGTAIAGTYTLLYTFPGEGRDRRCGQTMTLSGTSAVVGATSIKVGGEQCTGSTLTFKPGPRASFDDEARHSMLDKGQDTGVGPNPGGQALLKELVARGGSFTYAVTPVQADGGPGLKCGRFLYGPGTAYLIFNLDSALTVPFGTFPPSKRHLFMTSIGFTCIYQLSAPAPVKTPSPGTAPPSQPTALEQPAAPKQPTAPERPAAPEPPAAPSAQNEAGAGAGGEAANGTATALCFPAHATVRARTGDGAFERVRMDRLSIGDVIQDEGGRVSAVYGFSHRARDARAEFLRIALAGGKEITASAGHFLVGGDGRAVAAGAVRVGGWLSDRRGVPLRVVAVTRVCAKGLYAPLTMSGTLVVDDVAATVYTTALWPAGARAVLLPLRVQFAVRRFVMRVRAVVAAAREMRRVRRSEREKGMLGLVNRESGLYAAASRPVC